MFLFGTRSSRQKLASLIPVVAGVGFAYVIDLKIYLITLANFHS